MADDLKESGMLSDALVELHAEASALSGVILENECVFCFEEIAANEPVRPISDCVAQRQGTLWLSE
jgi:hypothetical protein